MRNRGLRGESLEGARARSAVIGGVLGAQHRGSGQRRRREWQRQGRDDQKVGGLEEGDGVTAAKRELGVCIVNTGYRK